MKSFLRVTFLRMIATKLPSLKSESSELEEVVKPLIQAANSNEWKEGLNILFYSGTILAFSEELRTPFLVEGKGDFEGIGKIKDLFDSKAKTELPELLSPMIKSFFPQIMTMAREIEKTESKEEESKKQFVAIISSMISEETFNNYKNVLGDLLVKLVFSGAPAATAGIFWALFSKREQLITFGASELSYEKMIDSLRMLHLIEPRLRANMCSKCGNYELTVSPHPTDYSSCPACGHKWACLVLHSFSPEFAKIKMNNFDYPLFVSAMLRNRIRLLSMLSDFIIYPLAKYNTGDGQSIEADVHLPELSIGIECKTHEEWKFPVTRERITGLAGKLSKQLHNYEKLGVKEVIILTNLDKQVCTSIELRLLKDVRENKFGQIRKLRLVDRNVESVQSVIDSLGKRFEKLFGNQLKSALKQAPSSIAFTKGK